MKEALNVALKEEVPLSFDEFKAKMVNGKFVCRHNNFASKVMLAPDNPDRLVQFTFQGQRFAKMIKDADRAHFLELCEEHTNVMRPFVGDSKKWVEIELTNECNERLWKLYEIARDNGISDKDLF
jgi:hypothetical protein